MPYTNKATNYFNRLEAFRDWKRAAAEAAALGIEIGDEPTEATPWRQTDKLTHQMRNRIDAAKDKAITEATR